jgi:Cu/Ag efflux protein CusF
LQISFAALTKSARRLSLVLLLFPALGMSVCNHEKANQQKVTGPAAAVQTTTYQSVGVVKSTNNSGPTIELDHEEIKGLMPAMTMEFYVSDKSLLQGIKPGDRVAFTIQNGVGGVKITRISKL